MLTDAEKKQVVTRGYLVELMSIVLNEGVAPRILALEAEVQRLGGKAAKPRLSQAEHDKRKGQFAYSTRKHALDKDKHDRAMAKAKTVAARKKILTDAAARRSKAKAKGAKPPVVRIAPKTKRKAA